MTTVSPTFRTSNKTLVAAALMGNLVEWYDYAVYGYSTIVIANVFFPNSDKTIALLETLAVLALTFLLRPIGGTFWGRLGDRIGRQPVLVIVIAIMGAATTLMGLLPGARTIGLWAPVLLLVLRLVQGFVGGGEYSGAMIFLGEHAPANRRGTWNGASVAFGAVPFSLAAAVVFVVTHFAGTASYAAWAWRVPFLIAAPLALVGVFLRVRVPDTPAFLKVKTTQQPPKWSEMTPHFKGMALLFVVASFNALVYYGVSSYMFTYMTATLHFSSGTTLLAVSLSLLVYIPACPLAGRLSDSLGRRPFLRGSVIAILVCTVPGYIVVGIGGLGFAILGLLLMLVPVVCLGALVATYQTEFFPTRVRYSCAGTSYNLAYAIFGGLAPFMSQWLVNATGSRFSPAFLVIVVGLIALAPIFVIPETYKHSISSDESPFNGHNVETGKPAVDVG